MQIGTSGTRLASAMATKRTYGEGCAAAHALDLVGERWALLVVRELLLGPKRFTDLRAGIAHASPNVLAQRLRELEEVGVITRTKLPPPAAARVYELTDWGRELEPVIVALGRFGARSPALCPDAGMSVDSLILALRTVFDREAAGDLRAVFELRLGDQRHRVAVAGGRLEADRGGAERPDAVISTDPCTFAALLWEGRRLTEAVRSGDVRIEGDRRAAARLLRLFPLPEPAAAAAARAG